jgi:bacterioferritin-associated ferredoxin
MFRPFLVLRGKLRSQAPQVGAESSDKLKELTWLDTACEYCLEPARQIIKYLNKSCEINPLCKVRVKSLPISQHMKTRWTYTIPTGNEVLLLLP